MAAVKHARGIKLLLKIGDGQVPQNFVAKCSFNSTRGITFTAATNDFVIPDCVDPDKVAWVAREKTSISVAVTGGGILNTPDVQDMYAFATSDEPRDCQIVVDVPAGDGGVIFEGPFHCTDFGITGERGGKQECSISLASDGEVTCVANA